jgi:hypothetical protein
MLHMKWPSAQVKLGAGRLQSIMISLRAAWGFYFAGFASVARKLGIDMAPWVWELRLQLGYISDIAESHHSICGYVPAPKLSSLNASKPSAWLESCQSYISDANLEFIEWNETRWTAMVNKAPYCISPPHERKYVTWEAVILLMNMQNDYQKLTVPSTTSLILLSYQGMCTFLTWFESEREDRKKPERSIGHPEIIVQDWKKCITG